MVKPKANGTLNTDTGRDLDVVWADVLKEYSRITEIPISNEESFETLTRRINQSIDESSSKNKSKAKDILNKAGTCIQKFGGMIAQAASMVFGPAGQCYNAISFVISAAKSIQEVIDGYITLLEHCVAFLQRITMHLESQRSAGEERLPYHLRGPVYKGLELFLKVQAHSRNLAKSKRTKLKVFCGVVLFSDDDGVKGNLDTLTGLSTELTGYTADQILEDVKGLARHLQKGDEERKVHEAECREHFQHLGILAEKTLDSSEKTRALVTELKSASQDEDNLKKIKTSFRAVNTKISDRAWVSQHKQRERIAGTCKWLLDSAQFKRWTNVNKPDKLVTLKGNAGFGKSHICSAVIDNITTYSKEASNERIYVAYYYYDKGDSVEDCLGSLVYQWASLDTTYRRAVANICADTGLFNKTKLWKSLVLDLTSAMQGHYFMVIDGYPGDDDNKIMRNVIQHSILPESVPLRLFLSGRYDDLEDLDDGPVYRLGGGKAGLMRQPTRPIFDASDEPVMRADLVNEQDVLDYARNRIDALCQKNPDLKATLQDPERNVAAKFARGAKGDFTSLESKLNEIAEAQDNDTIEEIILRAGETRKESCDRVLRDLYDTLTVEEIRELNILLKWVYEARESDEKLLGAVLLWCLGKSYFIGKQIDDKFKSVLRHDKRSLVSAVFLAETIRTATPRIGDEGNLDSSQGQGLQQCEVDIVQHFVKSYCSEELYERFKFHDFFRSKAADQTAIIHLDDAQRVGSSILQTCLEALCGGEKSSDSKFKALREYAATWLGNHLNDLDLFGPDQKSLQSLGSQLVTLLWDDNAIDHWWTPDLGFTLRYDWLQEDDFLQKLVDFLKHPPVLGNLDGSPQSQWVKSTIGAEGNNARILTRVAERLADRWFGEVRASMELFDCAQRIMYKIWNTDGEYSIWTVPSASEIIRFVQYVRERSTRSLSDVHWETRKASALLNCDHISEALEAVVEAERAAVEALPWNLLLVKARIKFELKNFQETLDCLHRAYPNDKLTEGSDTEYNDAYWDTALLLEGKCHKALSENEHAIECFVKLLKHGLSDDQDSYVHNEGITELYDTWRQMKHYHQILDHMKSWKRPENAQLDVHYWLPRLAFEDRFHRLVILATNQTKEDATHADVGELYEEAVKKLCESNDGSSGNDNADQLRYFRAMILYHGSLNPADHSKALTMWEKLMDTGDEANYFTWSKYLSFRTLALSTLDTGLSDFRGTTQGAEAAREAASIRLQESVKRLETLASANTPVLNMCRAGDSDPRLSLARLKLKIGDEKGFKRVLMARLQKQFDKWPLPTGTEALTQRYSSIAHTLTVADDDQNAIAAWQLVALPGQKTPASDEEDASKVDGAEANDEDQAQPGAAIGVDEDANPVDTAKESVQNGTVATSDDAVLGAANTDDTPEQTPLEKQDTEPATVDKSSEEPELTFGSTSPYRCDGDCGTDWPVVEDLYACKNCLDVQLCPGCHTKLKDEELPPMICSPKHEFLYVPKMDRIAWAKISAEEMIVDGRVVKRDTWLDELRDKWDLRQDQIAARRSRAAARFRAVVGAYVLSMKGYKKEDYTDDPKRIQLVDGVYKWV